MIKVSAFVLLPFLLTAQLNQNEINQHVWKPFIDAFSNHNTDKFMSVHSKDLTRSPREDNRVLTWQQYYEICKQGDEGDVKANRKRSIELRFIERISSDNQAVETGIYKTSYTKTDGSTKDFYGKFLVVLRKESGQWKILVDTDSSEGGTINEQSFKSAKSLE